MINVNEFMKYSFANGPGKRSVLWTQGCSLGCPGCRNFDTHSSNNNSLMDVQSILEMIPDDIDGITLSGGEPMQQRVEILKLAKLYQEKYPNKNVICFSGYTIQEIKKFDEFPDIKKYIDLMITGRFVLSKSENDSWKEWKGSSNQELIYFSEKIDQLYRNKYRHEIQVNNGSSISTGFPTDSILEIVQ